MNATPCCLMLSTTQSGGVIGNRGAVQLAGREGLANATKDESSLNGGDALVYCGQPDGQRQLLRLRELPDTMDGVAQVLFCSALLHRSYEAGVT